MSTSADKNILKIRDDSTDFELVRNEESGDYSFADETQISSWLAREEGKAFTKSDLRKGIEPWLTSLFQSEHLSLLVGSGLSIAVENIATGHISNVMSVPELETDYAERIEASAHVAAKKSGRGDANVEDYIRTINELLRGFEVLGYDTSEKTDDRVTYDKLGNDLERIIKDLTEGIGNIENSIVLANEAGQLEAFGYLVNFLMSFASRTGTRDRLNIFTTNYDRVIEAGSELAGLHLLDRFIGTLTPIFRSSRLDIDMHYNPPGIRGEPRYLEGVAHFTKLHGSIDWVNTGSDIRRIGLPFGSKDIKNFLDAPGIKGVDAWKLMIYPNSAKDRETAEYPYVELFRDFAAALCRPNSTLVTYGYSFGDEHINRIIRDMLTIPSTHLVIISHGDKDGRIIKNYKEFGHPSQVSLIIGSGVADLKTLVDYLLPKSAIDRTTIRMGELLRQRYLGHETEAAVKSDGGEGES